MKYNAYRDFANGLCYVLTSTPHQAGTTLYTEKALAKAKEMLAQYQLTENALIAEGDNTFAVYDSAPALLAFSPKTQEQKAEECFVCAFTGHNEAEHVREKLLRGGLNCDKLVMTYDELSSQAAQQGGIIVDWFVYNFIIPKEEFHNVEQLGKFDGPIVVELRSNADVKTTDSAEATKQQ